MLLYCINCTFKNLKKERKMDFLKKEKYDLDFIGAIILEAKKKEKEIKNKKEVRTISIVQVFKRLISLVALFFLKNIS